MKTYKFYTQKGCYKRWTTKTSYSGGKTSNSHSSGFTGVLARDLTNAIFSRKRNSGNASGRRITRPVAIRHIRKTFKIDNAPLERYMDVPEQHEFKGKNMTELDSKIVSAFPGKIVRKDLTALMKRGSNVPTYVLEYLLGNT